MQQLKFFDYELKEVSVKTETIMAMETLIKFSESTYFTTSNPTSEIIWVFPFFNEIIHSTQTFEFSHLFSKWERRLHKPYIIRRFNLCYFLRHNQKFIFKNRQNSRWNSDSKDQIKLGLLPSFSAFAQKNHPIV